MSPCEGCKFNGAKHGCRCVAYKKWFKKEWDEIREAAEVIKNDKVLLNELRDRFIDCDSDMWCLEDKYGNYCGLGLRLDDALKLLKEMSSADKGAEKVEVSLTEETIHKLARELARQINLMGGCR